MRGLAMGLQIVHRFPLLNERQIFRIGSILMQIVENASLLGPGGSGKTQQKRARFLQFSWLGSKVCNDSYHGTVESTTRLHSAPTGVARHVSAGRFPYQDRRRPPIIDRDKAV